MNRAKGNAAQPKVAPPKAGAAARAPRVVQKNSNNTLHDNVAVTRASQTRRVNGRVDAARAQLIRKQLKRRRRAIRLVAFLLLSFSLAMGVVAGRAAGWVAELVRTGGIPLLHTGSPTLAAAKVAPPDPVAEVGPAQACVASSLALTVLVDQPSLQPGEPTGVHVTVRNSGWNPCLINGGMENIRLRLVNSVGKQAWSAEHCGLEGSRQLLIGPGNMINFDLVWDGHNSAPGVCTGDQPLTDGGTWQFIASLAEVAHSDSEPSVIVVHGAVAPEPEPLKTPDSQGVTSQGVTSQGVTSEGVTSEGVTDLGVTLQN